MYTDPIIKKYRELIETAMPGVFKSFFQGDPFRIPASNLPALIISKSGTGVGPHSNAEDSHEIALSLTVVTDIRAERSDEQSMTPGIAQLYDIIEGREDTTYKLKDNQCILDILRKNQIVDATYNLRTNLGSITQVNYGLTQGRRSAEGYATEAQVDFIATYSQLRT